MLSLTRDMVREFGKHKIRVNSICSGCIHTTMMDRTRATLPDPKTVVNRMTQAIPLQGLGKAEDIARVALVLWPLLTRTTYRARHWWWMEDCYRSCRCRSIGSGRNFLVEKGSCERIEDRLLPGPSVRRSARSTWVQRALRARCHCRFGDRMDQGWLTRTESREKEDGRAT